jgi:hypothetical protein
MSRAVALVLASASLFGLLGAASAHAGSVDRAFSDTSSAPTPSAALTSLDAQRSVCRVGRSGNGRLVLPSLSRALATARGVLSSDSSRAKLAALLDSSSLARGRGDTVGLAGLAKGKPGVALLGFLAAHQRDPSDPLPLLDAAVILSSLGHQLDALALLAGAERLAAPGAQVGVSVRALIDNARGVALFRLGRLSQATEQFRVSSGLASSFSAPERNLAAALLCRGHAQEAVTPYIDSTYTDPVQSEPPPSGSPSGGDELPNPNTALDLSQGIPGTLPTLKIPQTAEAGAASQPLFESLHDADFTLGEQEEVQGDGEAGQAAFAALKSRTLTGQRDYGIWQLWEDWATDDSALDALLAKTQGDFTTMESVQNQLGNSDNAAQAQCVQLFGSAQQQCLQECGATAAGNHATWLPQEVAYNQDERAFASAIYMYATGLASNLTNPAMIAGITEQARGLMIAIYAGELGEIWNFTSWELGLTSPSDLDCFSTQGDAASDNGMTDTPPAQPCPPALSAVKFGLKLGIFNATINCDAITISASDGGPISPYVSAKYKFKDGSITALVGAKAGLPIDPDAGDKSKLSATGGVYVTWDAKGNVTDVGLKVSGPSLGTTVGANTVGTADAETLEVSLAPYLLPPPSLQ